MSLEAIILWQDAISWWLRGGISEEASLAYHKFFRRHRRGFYCIFSRRIKVLLQTNVET